MRTRIQPNRYGMIDYNREVYDEDHRRLFYHDVCLTISNPSGEPASYNDVIQNEYKDEWIKSMDKELNALKANVTFEIISEVPQSTDVIKSKWVFKNKVHSDGTIKRKSRLVACGYSQIHGVNYDQMQIFAPTLTQKFNPKRSSWCSNCKMDNHTNSTCRKSNKSKENDTRKNNNKKKAVIILRQNIVNIVL